MSASASTLPAPAVGTFTYSKLLQGHIRLLRLDDVDRDWRICCSLEATPLKDCADQYDALSYSWNGEKPTIPIICNNQRLWITHVLYQALRALHRVSQSRPIWTDAICINQIDDAEKASQVPLMANIYSQASSVLVWLGPSGPNTDLALDAVQVLNDRLDKVSVSNSYDDLEAFQLPNREDPIWHGLRDIFGRTWFQRLWTLQEVVVSRHVVIRCGSRSMEWRDAALLVERLLRVGYTQLAISSDRAKPDILSGLGSIRGIGQLMELRHHGKTAPLDYLAYLAKGRAVSEPVDKVYAIIGLTDRSLYEHIKIDYTLKSRQQYWKVYIDQGQVLLQRSSDLRCLTMADSRERPRELPSWCPNFNSSRGTYELALRHYDAGGEMHSRQQSPHIASSIDKTQIMLHGLQVDQVMEVGQLSSDWLADYIENKSIAVYAVQALRWLNDCRRVQRTASGESDDALEPFVRTLIANMLRVPDNYDPMSDLLLEMNHVLMECLRRFTDPLHYPKESLNKRQTELSSTYLNALNVTCRGRVFFATRNGRIGVGPCATQAGDMVCVFRTCEIPLILREKPETAHFTLVGEAYVHGIMHGEALDMPRQGLVQEKLFTIA